MVSKTFQRISEVFTNMLSENNEKGIEKCRKHLDSTANHWKHL
jgi:hypothetical protein